MEEEALQRQSGHVKKRSLKNKALGISFDEKDLQNYVTGFHKRKKKRRKEAHKQQEEARRRKRNEERQKRKLERELVSGVVPPTTDTEPGEIDDNQDEVQEHVQSIAGTKTYENDDLKVTVVTRVINPDEEESCPIERKEAAVTPHSVVTDKKKAVPISNRSHLKRLQNTGHSQSREVREIKGKERSQERSDGPWHLASSEHSQVCNELYFLRRFFFCWSLTVLPCLAGQFGGI
ncbi:LOW QUALITY PROTEIN: uncharacterized protein [Cicer arietinum]|uniref:LOW QUALITY PROTEIN: nucleolar protein 12 n=1 Tax=Cicer arietinum TaxID=3827 RepID=A0A3Q7YC99_CICAR|nr:LOW QUALITY PROTEIN: nucleolar protein 12 [Cicer arietinum]